MKQQAQVKFNQCPFHLHSTKSDIKVAQTVAQSNTKYYQVQHPTSIDSQRRERHYRTAIVEAIAAAFPALRPKTAPDVNPLPPG